MIVATFGTESMVIIDADLLGQDPLLLLDLAIDEVFCEVHFSVSDDDAVTKGVLDVVYRKGTDWHVVDYKTNARPYWLDQVYLDQLAAYRRTSTAALRRRVECTYLLYSDSKARRLIIIPEWEDWPISPHNFPVREFSKSISLTLHPIGNIIVSERVIRCELTKLPHLSGRAGRPQA